MKYVSKLVVIIAVSLMGQYAVAQPPARIKENAKKEQKAATAAVTVNMTERAKSQYPATVVPQEVVWKRDIYRSLDLKNEKNASLYYPVEPMGGSVNLFTYVFRLILDGTITAYKYNLDGYESFDEENKIAPKDLLDNYRIYYEEQDGGFVVNKSDVPSGEVLSYYIKESNYYDQRTATYNTRVTAICPVLHRTANEFSTEIVKYPMSSMTINDYFVKNCYDGEIYKTVNLRNLALNQYCKDSTAVKKEQANIEKQLADFRANLWNTPKPVVAAATDSTTVASDSAATEKSEKKSLFRSTKKKSSDKKESAKKKKSSKSSSGGAKVSVRRTRR